MVIAKKIHALRQKPQHVRERILLTCLIILVPLLLIGGYFAFRYERAHAKRGSSTSIFKNFGSFLSNTVQDAKQGVSDFKQGSSSDIQ